MQDKARRDVQGFAEKRRRILRAAAAVFARKGYTGTRVSDIAREADIAYGLVYHYFQNKEDLLNCLFQENWALSLKVVEQIDAEGGGLRHKLLRVAGFFLQARRQAPDIVEVLMIEVVRSPKCLERPNIEAFHRIFELLERMLIEHQARGEVRPDVDPRLTAVLFVGSLEILLTGAVARDLLPEDTIAEAGAETLVDTFVRGIAPA